VSVLKRLGRHTLFALFALFLATTSSVPRALFPEIACANGCKACGKDCCFKDEKCDIKLQKCIPRRIISGIRFDNMCSIPEKYRDDVDEAFRVAAKTIAGKKSCRDAYTFVLKEEDKLTQMVQKFDSAKFALADNCKSLGDRLEKAHGSRAIQEVAYSQVGGDTMWFAESTLKAGTSKIVCSILHEMAHLAGANADPIMEMAIEKIHNGCACPR